MITKNADVAELLIAKGADVNARDGVQIIGTWHRTGKFHPKIKKADLSWGQPFAFLVDQTSRLIECIFMEFVMTESLILPEGSLKALTGDN